MVSALPVEDRSRDLICADYKAVIAFKHKLLEIQTDLLEFLDSRFGGRVRCIYRYDGIVLGHTLHFSVVSECNALLRWAPKQDSGFLLGSSLNLAEKDRALKAELDRQRAKEQTGQQEKAYER
jgi:hypothetical protein